MFNSILNFFQKNISSSVSQLIALITIIFSVLTYYVITEKFHFIYSNPKKVITLILMALILFLSFAIILLRKIFKKFFDRNNEHSFLRDRIILAFSLVSIIPTVIVAIFSAYIFNFSIQAWFNQKILAILDESIIVARSYIEDHTIQLKETALSVSNDFSEMYYDLTNNPSLFPEILNAQAQMRSLDEAIIFQSSTNTLIAQTRLSFSLSFATIPQNLIEMANQGKIVEIKTDPAKIRMLIKLPEYKDTYLLIGRLIDRKIINHIDITNGAAREYYDLKNDIKSVQIKFSIIFLLVALLLLCVAISWGVTIASQIVKPIRQLVNATEKAKDGDLTVQIKETGLPKDEIMILTTAFNRMIKQINRQQKDLIIAQRALAWSDVARRVAHEIKNPLTPIQLASERLKKFEKEISDPSSFNKYIATILNHSKDIEKIVTEFVNFARLPLPEFSICEIVEEIRTMIESRKLINDKIIYNFSSNMPKIEFTCDLSQINQVILNLIKNSEEALAGGKDEKIIKIELEKTADELIILVKDNGPGFPSYLINKATEAYITTRPKGTGLGLAIVKKIVQDHLGSIEIQNLHPTGSKIKLLFNLRDLGGRLSKA